MSKFEQDKQHIIDILVTTSLTMNEAKMITKLILALRPDAWYYILHNRNTDIYDSYTMVVDLLILFGLIVSFVGAILGAPVLVFIVLLICMLIKRRVVNYIFKDDNNDRE